VIKMLRILYENSSLEFWIKNIYSLFIYFPSNKIGALWGGDTQMLKSCNSNQSLK
jgi:hypothetical protein